LLVKTGAVGYLELGSVPVSHSAAWWEFLWAGAAMGPLAVVLRRRLELVAMDQQVV
jgi:hypothetical protein